MMTEQTPGIPLWAPDYRVGFGGAIGRFWRKYADFTGRASRAEYWWTVLFLGLGYIVALLLSAVPLLVESIATSTRGMGNPPIFTFAGPSLYVLWFLATLVPWLAVQARRLHDGNFSGFLLFLLFVFSFGALAVFVMCQLSPNPLGRRFDAPPGEPPRGNRIASWPPAPGEPDRWFDGGTSAAYGPGPVTPYGPPAVASPVAPTAPPPVEAVPPAPFVPPAASASPAEAPPRADPPPSDRRTPPPG